MTDYYRTNSERRTAIGIDLGTTYGVVAYREPNGSVRVLRDERHSTKVPSVVWFAEDGEVVVGEDAKGELTAGSRDVASFFKRFMGDPSYSFEARGRDYSATELSSFVLKELKALAEKELGRPIADAVVTVPAYFNHPQREATIEAARRVGLNALRIVNEPTAAALAYGNAGARRGRYLVYDLGGGTFDASAIEIDDDEIRVLATDGDHRLGGKDWDDRIRDYAADVFQDETGLDLFADPAAVNETLVQAEKLKIALSDRSTARFRVRSQGESAVVELSRETFEKLTVDLLTRTENLCEATLAGSSPPISWEDLDGVLLVGGSTRIPAVREFARRASGRELLSGVNVDEAVAVGAAIQAANDLDAELEELERKGSSRESAFASNRSGRSTSMRVLKDATSHSLGMIAENEDRSRYVASVILRKNLPIPADETRSFRLRVGRGREKEAELEVYLLQGESENPLEDLIIGRHVFSGFQPEPSGWAKVDVTYRYDRNGVVETFATQTSCRQRLKRRVEAVPDDMSWVAEPPKSDVEPLAIVFALDVSGSMDGAPVRKAKEAFREFVDRLDFNATQVGALVFADRTQTILEPTNSVDSITAAVSKIEIGGGAGFGTSANPFPPASQLLEKFSDRKRYIFVLTDGMWEKSRRALNGAERCKQEGIEIVALGFGDADERFLQKLASSSEGAIFTKLERLSEGFSTIAQVITKTQRTTKKR